MSNEAPDDEVAPQDKESASKQSTTLNETTSREKGEHDVVIICSIRSRPIPLNYASLTVVTKEQVQDMIGQAMDYFAKQQRQGNDQFELSIQNTITTQFSNLDVVLLQNLQQA